MSAPAHECNRDNVHGNWLSRTQGEKRRGFRNPIDGLAG